MGEEEGEAFSQTSAIQIPKDLLNFLNWFSSSGQAAANIWKVLGGMNASLQSDLVKMPLQAGVSY